jgi:DNA-binding protein H-NS
MPTLEVLQEKMKKLQAQADVLIAKKAQFAVNQIRSLMLEHGLTTLDIEAKAAAKRESKAARNSASATKSRASSVRGTKVAPKYQDPKTGATWTGRGSAPAWISKVKDRTKFLIADHVVLQGNAPGKVKPATKKAPTAGARGGQPKGPQPAKYRHPKSGATWSGKGRAPAWLANVRNRAKFLIEAEDAAAAVDTPVVAKAIRKISAVTKKATATKKVAMKAAAKKVTTKKLTAAKTVAKEAPPTKSAIASKRMVSKKSEVVAKKSAAKKTNRKAPAAKKRSSTPEITVAPESVIVEPTV